MNISPNRKLNVDEHQDLLILYNLPLMKKRAIQELQGISAAVIYDGVLSDDEIKLIGEWLVKNAFARDDWPISRLICVLQAILEDNVVTLEERKELLAFLSGIAADPNSEEVATSIFDANPVIQFSNRSFLFTGILQFGKRNKAERVVTENGGYCCSSYSSKVDYLVVGELGQDSWKYGRYGTKIEACMNAKSRGEAKTFIVSELDFVKFAVNGRGV
ncbi:MAG: BRCT domain-containing protein [Syntrophales bacterium]|jgi:NAD-dependent DNA ligase|nr:BRCT domain-containing protein [Syntrophales bacterium]